MRAKALGPIRRLSVQITGGLRAQLEVIAQLGVFVTSIGCTDSY
ncbi:hypothetical protein N1032_15240 [Herbiconiux sp. CPCC 203386]|uniref:Uncharacterized protein n=1 Tax=Herbiconiux daphne TaxID=2970914 RepID=A0ABT2H584_9MICO|nr:hypothetical protein [Herbiconiux daphne]